MQPLLIQIMVTNTVLVCCSATGTDWYFHGICSVLAHTEKLSQKSFARVSNFFSNLLSHCVVYSNVSKEIGKQFRI